MLTLSLFLPVYQKISLKSKWINIYKKCKFTNIFACSVNYVDLNRARTVYILYKKHIFVWGLFGLMLYYKTTYLQLSDFHVSICLQKIWLPRPTITTWVSLSSWPSFPSVTTTLDPPSWLLRSRKEVTSPKRSRAITQDTGAELIWKRKQERGLALGSLGCFYVLGLVAFRHKSF